MFELLQEQEFYLLFKMSRPTPKPTHPPIQSVLGAVSLGIMWLGHEVGRPPQTSVEAKNKWGYTSTPFICFQSMYNDNFTFLVSVMW